jgi:maltooligosyltrehalose trehalohydrolase
MPSTLAATHLDLGANLSGNQCAFRVWAPNAQTLRLRLNGKDHEMRREAHGVFALTLPAGAGEKYFYIVDGGKTVADPVSRSLPEGVHGPTEIIDPENFQWSQSEDAWRGLELRSAIIYELHVGTFTPAGTFDAVIERLDYLKKLGVTVLELMPVAAFPGDRNWGYDGVSPYAVQSSYGGPAGLKRLVNAAHRAGLGVMLDVVYNHLGHEGNYLRLFGPYFTSRHQTPWGDAVNFDGTGADGIRRYVIENALYWIREYHLDGLRLDAVQTIYDDSPRHILAEIQERVQSLAHDLGRRVLIIAETDANDPKLIRPAKESGYGLDAVWSDDFHHAVHTLFTGERSGYYQDFGQPRQIARTLAQGFCFQGELFNFWGKSRGAPPTGIPLERHVFCIQNHDQVGNRAKGERLSQLLPPGACKVAAALLLLAPETPLLFMGEEYGESAPFQYFTSYGDRDLARAVSEGRRREFKDFSWDEVPDPQDPATFARSKLHWEQAGEENEILRWYCSLIALRKKYLSGAERTCRAEILNENSIRVELSAADHKLILMASLKPGATLPAPDQDSKLLLHNSQDGFDLTLSLEQ